MSPPPRVQYIGYPASDIMTGILVVTMCLKRRERYTTGEAVEAFFQVMIVIMKTSGGDLDIIPHSKNEENSDSSQSDMQI